MASALPYRYRGNEVILDPEPVHLGYYSDTSEQLDTLESGVHSEISYVRASVVSRSFRD